ncbi:MAG: CBS domain-containing protein [Nitrososphaerota archaeon]
MWSDVRVRDIVRKPLITVDASDTVRYVAGIMVKNNISGVVVTDGGRPVGLVTERDLVAKVLAGERDPEALKARDIMSRPLITVDVDTKLSEAIDLMNRKRIRRLVATESGKVVGIFTQRDILALERICGYCANPVRPNFITRPGESDVTVSCSCGLIYHMDCAKTVVYCLNCSRQIVTEVVYPRPEDTTGG